MRLPLSLDVWLDTDSVFIFFFLLHYINMTLMHFSSLKHCSAILGMQSPALCKSGDEFGSKHTALIMRMYSRLH